MTKRMNNEESTHFLWKLVEDGVDQHVFQTVGIDPFMEDEVTLVFSL